MRASIMLLWFAPAVAGAAVATNAVDLTAPGALESLQRSRPEHYATVRAILEAAKVRPGPGTDRWIEARFDAADVELLQWQVSDPPRLKVSFTLDHTRYTGVVVPALAPPGLVPLR